jgi:creatinine amidohydrolase
MSLLEWASLDRESIARAFPETVVVLPIGALEQHGPHLATGTDFISATEIVGRAARKAAKPVLVLPPVPYGLSHYHTQFGATVALRAETLSRALNEICESVRLCGAKTLFIINGHGGNRGICTTTALEMSTQDFRVFGISYWDLAPETAKKLFAADQGSVGHAGQAETSIVAAIRPDLFRPARPIPHEPIGPSLGLTAIQRLGATGVSGDPAAASVELGERFIDEIVDRMADLFDGKASTEAGNPR